MQRSESGIQWSELGKSRRESGTETEVDTVARFGDLANPIVTRGRPMGDQIDFPSPAALSFANGVPIQ